MATKYAARHLALTGLLSLSLSGCYHPPFNNFKPYNSMPKDAAKGAGVGAIVGVVASHASSGFIPGGAIAGGVVGSMVSLYKDSKPSLIRELEKADIQFVEYGDTMTLIVPTDRYFLFNTPELNDICYPALVNIIKLLRLYPRSPIYVAGFTDNIGSRKSKQLMSQARAEAMLTFLWANGVAARRLTAEGYGDKNTIGDNSIIHGSAYNRRLEIQWFSGPLTPAAPPLAMAGWKK
ncbi:C-OmpA-like family protein CmpA [Legionella spiritensis]|uniref:C-OmpA-like family protein CmpA n=1 Tax=Legionella spiritensis TaxID=452 RepID=UPI000F6DFECA|nr:C-OmpA-like family protein CmpA [Legionella spiritensis]VEG91896.1 outer membrane protein, OmpA family protein [Legionella spiritensis]